MPINFPTWLMLCGGLLLAACGGSDTPPMSDSELLAAAARSKQNAIELARQDLACTENAQCAQLSLLGVCSEERYPLSLRAPASGAALTAAEDHNVYINRYRQGKPPAHCPPPPALPGPSACIASQCTLLPNS
ncbi:hypothetical protein [Ottowia testudinis]|uniref:Uncharacterized protein n=1 Tax=Ottowia testudinis TaxID=2816950 RepID=A0A975H4C4_9BURK|nr:hypothetical protein [Ottowia testudinis]QTD46171.1 hypothetical protein J1M35_04500 [Ottowia testudinis]